MVVGIRVRFSNAVAFDSSQVLDTWTWGEAGDNFGTTYFNVLSAVANLWRSPGSPQQIRNAARKLFNDIICEKYFRKMPGRCLRGRWLSRETLERILLESTEHIGAVFAEIWGNLLEPDQKSKADLGKDEDDEWQARQHRMRCIAARVTSSSLWLSMVAASHSAHQPLVHFMHWLQKASKEHKGKHERANAEGRVFVGKTPLSELVSHKAAEVRREIVNLLGPDGENDPGFAIAHSLLPERLANRGRQLFATLVLSLLASWDFRITEKMSAFPLLLLVFAENRRKNATLADKQPRHCSDR